MNLMKNKDVGICFCLCSHLSLSSPLLRGHPLLRVASPLWPGWREESASLSASSFHLACLSSKQILFIYLSQRLSLAFFFCSASFSFFSFFFLLLFDSLYFPPLPGPLSLILSWLRDFSTTCSPYSRDSERKGTGSVGYSCGKHIQTCTKPIHDAAN